MDTSSLRARPTAHRIPPERTGDCGPQRRPGVTGEWRDAERGAKVWFRRYRAPIPARPQDRSCQESATCSSAQRSRAAAGPYIRKGPMLAGSVRALLRRAYLLAPALVAATLPAQTRGANARARGRADAPVTVYEMSDFQCPFCRQFTLDALPEIERDFIRTGKVRWVFVAYPLLRIHKNAEAAAEFALCAARQNRFWEVHDLLFRHQPDWADLDGPERVFLRLADSARLNRAALTTCVNAHATRGEV